VTQTDVILGDRKGIWPVKKLTSEVLDWHGYLSAAMSKRFAYGPADATAIHHLLLQ